MQVTRSYETVQELCRTGVAAVYSARPAAGTQGGAVGPPSGLDLESDSFRAGDMAALAQEPRYAIKLLQPALFMIDGAALKGMIKTFLERAAAQRAAAAGAAAAAASAFPTDTSARSHWAPIYELGEAADGAFYVTDLFSRSAQKLIERRTKVDHEGLLHIVDSVFQGLGELQAATARAHANLKPSNVLIGGGRSLAEARVALTDPASMRDMLALGGESADLRGVGELIHQLVTFRPSDKKVWPVPRSPGWSRLGSHAKAWRELCSRLLAPDLGGLSLEDAHGQLHDLRPGRRTMMRNVLAGAAVVVAVAASAGGAWYVKYQREWSALNGENTRWFAAIRAPLTGELKLQANTDPAIKSIIEKLQESERAANPVVVDPVKIAGGKTAGTMPPLSFDARDKTRVALQRVQEIKDQLRPAKWGSLREWQERLKKNETELRVAPSLYLRKFLAGAPDAKGEPVGDRLVPTIKAVLYLQSIEGRKEFDELEQLSRTIDAQRIKLEKTELPEMKFFAKEAKAGFERVLGEPGDEPRLKLVALREQAKTFADLGDELEKAVAESWDPAKVNQRRYLADSAGAPVTLDSLRKLPERLRSYKLEPNRGKEVVALLEAEQRDVKQQINTLKGIPGAENLKAAAAAELQLDAAMPKVQRIRADEWMERDTKLAVEVDVLAELKKIAADLRVVISRAGGNPADWLKSVRNFTSTNESVAQAYQKKLDELLKGRDAGALEKDRPGLLDLQERVPRWSNAFAEVDKRLPAAVVAIDAQDDPDGTFGKAAKQRFDETVRLALATVKDVNGSPTVDAAAIDALRAQYDTDVKSLAELATDTRAAVTALNEGFGLSEAGGTAGPAAWEQKWAGKPPLSNPAIAKVVDPLRQRIAALRAVDSFSSEDCANAINGARTPPEVGVAALRRMLISNTPPPSVEDLRREAAIRKDLDALLKKFVKTPARFDAIRASLVSGADKRWAGFLNEQKDPAEFDAAISAALETAETFGVRGRADVAPWMQYNMRLRELRESLTADAARGVLPNEAAVKALAQKLVESGAEQRQVDQLVNQLGQLTKDKVVKGPGAPWKLATSDDNSRVYVNAIDEFTRRTLRFRLVTPSNDAPPFFLCTTELPLELLLDEWDRADQELRQLLPATNEEMSGPCGWEWDGARRMRHRITWLRNKQPFADYAPGLVAPGNSRALKNDEDNPKPSRHPAQQLPPRAAEKLAALMGCRLPSPDEWRAAVQVSPTPVRDRNLRDATWATQFAYIANLQTSDAAKRELLPTAGIFVTGAPERTNSLSSNDNKLWFSAIDSGSGGQNDFRHLVGNVAEYVFEPSSGEYGVIGASAMSPADMAIDTAFKIDSANLARGYSDVGLRLAFSAPGSEAKRLAKLVASLPYRGPQ